MKIQYIVVGALGVNCYILSSGDKALIVDPGGDYQIIKKYLDANGLTPLKIINTHGHFDHIGAVQELKDEYGIKFYLHKDDEALLDEAPKALKLYNLPHFNVPTVDGYIADGEVIEFEGADIKVLHTPGHTPGGCCLYIPSEKHLLTGDTVFQQSVGRTDFQYADHELMIQSIRDKVLTLDDSTVICPGHGPYSSVMDEKEYNPFL